VSARQSNADGEMSWNLRQGRLPIRRAWLVVRFVLLPVLLWGCFQSRAVAQAPSASEVAAFNAAARAFQDAIFERAQAEFAEFVRKFPQSAKGPEAVLLQAQAALNLGNSRTAAALLATNLPNAGVFTEQYHYWLGEVHLQSSNYVAAADSFGRLLKDFPESPRVLRASHDQALALFHLKDWARVIELLRSPEGSFQKLARTRAADDLVVRGFLLLSEALMENGQLQDAEKIVTELRTTELAPELKWHRDYLLCRIQIADRRLPAALAGSSNLVTLADQAALPVLRAESVTLQGTILQQLNDLSGAAAAYEQNLRKEIPPEQRRQSLLKIIDLTLAQDALDEAARKLERLLVEHPLEAGSDVARLTLGELRLKQYFAPSTNLPVNATLPATNALSAALLQFDELIKSFPTSPLIGKAQLNRGWCLWESGKTAESATAFKAATDQLPHSPEQAIARFKIGDALLFRNDYSNALGNFQAVLAGYNDLPELKQSLLPHAWYHLLRCSIELNDFRQASDAMNQILHSYAESRFADRSMLFLGQQLSTSQRPHEARKLFHEFGKRFPESSLRPEVDLAVARSYEREMNWAAATSQYDDWVVRYSTNDLRPRAEFYRAWANSQAGQKTNALLLYTNFLAEFPTHSLAPLAQNWVADFYFTQGDFVNAEFNYQLLFQNTNWPLANLTYHARMMAGRAAYAREGYSNAKQYFRDLVNDKTCPTNLAAEAFYALGDTMIREADPGDTPLQKFAKAEVAFNKIPDLFPANDLVPLAWGRIGDCYLQMAAFESKFYESAIEAYQKVPQSDFAAHSLAEIGLGTVLERQAKLPTTPDPEPLLKAAFDHYYNVVSGKDLDEGKVDLVYFKKAALAAARVAEERKQWETAIRVYNRLISLVPTAKAGLEKKIERAAEQLRLEKN
jgi:TolA-binding protein